MMMRGVVMLESVQETAVQIPQKGEREKRAGDALGAKPKELSKRS